MYGIVSLVFRVIRNVDGELVVFEWHDVKYLRHTGHRLVFKSQTSTATCNRM